MKQRKKRVEKLSRRPWQRIMRIHEWILRGDLPNCVRMAVDLSVSEKTVKRDVEFMRDSLGMPIEYDAQRHGYFYSERVDKFPAVAVTEQEIFALLVAEKAIAQYQGTPFQKPLRMAFQKLTGQLDTGALYSLEHLQEALSFRPFGPEDTDLQAFETITRGVQEQRALTFRYRNLATRSSQERRVRPYHLTCIDNRWYLLAHDVKRNDIRTFALTRLSAPVLTDDRFEKPKDWDPNEYLRGSFAVMKGEADYEVVIEFDAWATDLLRGRQWHPTQETLELPSGESQMRMRLSNLEEVERWVLSWGAHATVVRPEALRERIKRSAQQLVERYGGSTGK